MVRWLSVTAMFLIVATPAAAADHVRVVLDISKSMVNNDKWRLATLSTVLLHDLAHPDAVRGDTFQVIPFDPAVRRWTAQGSLPTGTGARVVADPANRDVFVRALTSLAYQANYTYFYPTLAAAIGDFESSPGESGDRRVIVLITDGVPEPETRAEEERRLHQELVPRLRATGARLYVLAFGPEASSGRAFFDALVAGGLGEVFVDAGGERLLESMIEIFSRSFGYTADVPVALHQNADLDLEGGQNPTEVAVVSFWLSREPRPLTIRPSPNAPRGVQRTQERQAGYALQWVLQPRPGRYAAVSDGAVGRVTVLRPARLRMAVRPGRAGIRTDFTIARTRFPLQVVVAPYTGADGDPGEVDLSYEVCVPVSASGLRCGNPAPPVRAAGTVETTGRVYDIEPIFLVDTDLQAEFYLGEIRITAKRREAVVARSVLRVTVYPFVELSAIPPILTVPRGREALRPGNRGCATFSLVVTGGRLPHPDNPAYAIRAVLPAAVADAPQFAGATFMLDGGLVDIESKPRPVPGPWYSGRALRGDVLLQPHEICVQVGRPRAGDASRPAMVELVVTLREPPYDGYTIVPRPVTVGVLVAPPGWIDRAAQFVLLLGLLTTMALLWYDRSRPFVAGDLRCVLLPPEGGEPLSENALAPGPWPFRALGLQVSRPIITHAGTEIGRMRPVSPELYDLRLARGVTLQDPAAGPLETHRTYIANTKEGAIGLRVEYQ